MKTLLIAGAFILPAAAFAQSTMPAQTSDSTMTPSAMSPEATPSNTTQANPQTNPGIPSVKPAGSKMAKHKSMKTHSSNATGTKSSTGGNPQ